MAERENDEAVVPLYLLMRSLRGSMTSVLEEAKEARAFVPDYDPERAEEADAELSAIVALAESLEQLPLNFLPRDVVEKLGNVMRELAASLRQLREGRAPVEPQLAEQVWSSISERFTLALSLLQNWLPLLTVARTPIADLSSLRLNLDALTKEQDSFPRRIENIVAASVSQFTRQLHEISELKAAAQDAVGKIGVDKHTVNFSEVRDEHARWARYWLLFSAIVVLVTLSSVFWIPGIFVISGDWTQPENAQKLGLKLLFLSTILYVGAQALRTYRTHRHLEVVNKHRAVSLLTFRSFVDAATDEQVKSAILLEAARTIFAPVSTGYVRAQDDDPDSRLFELAQLLRGR